MLEDIALAHREIYVLYDMAQAMGASLGLPDTMGLITGKLSNLVPYSCAAVFLLDEGTDTLRCHFATGTDAELVQQVVVRTGEGLTGWVARNRRPLVNARPQADFEAAGVPAQPAAAVGAGLPAAGRRPLHRHAVACTTSTPGSSSTTTAGCSTASRSRRPR